MSVSRTAVLALLATGLSGVWPLQPDPEVIAPFRPPSVAWQSGHRGVDLTGATGQPAHAAVAGVVSFAGRVAGRGVVVVRHGRTRTTYEPVAAAVAVGDPIAAGQVIGTLERLGSHCLPDACLHWGLIDQDETYLDPLSLLDCAPRPVRLLPQGRAAARTPKRGGPCPSIGSTPGQQLVRTLLRLAGVLAGRPAAVDRR